jgi:two-component system cell cycle response regulator
MDGFEVCQKIKERPESMHVPVVMITALSDAADRVRGIECGADDFLTKPVNDVALFARVRSLVRLKMVMDEWRLREQTAGQLGAFDNDRPLIKMSATKANILILDDNDVDALNIVDTLGVDDDIVLTAKTVTETYERAQERDFDLLIINLNIRGQDALRLCSQLRSSDKTRQIPIILVVEDDQDDQLIKGFDLGVNDYLIKPVDRNELLARARTQIRRWRYHNQLRRTYERSIEMALTDGLTGLYNRRYLTAHLDGQITRMEGGGKPMSLIMFDIDLFKKVNDSHGHAVGDAVLRELASRIGGNLRVFDTVARYGGEEFVIVMPDTEISIACVVAERLRSDIAGRWFEIAGATDPISITISVGVAMAFVAGDTSSALLSRADEAMYYAKNAGRNRAVLWDDDTFKMITNP